MSDSPRVRMTVTQLEDRTTPANVVLPDASTFLSDRVLLSLADGVDRASALATLNASPLVQSTEELGFGVFRLKLKAGVSVQTAVNTFADNTALAFVEPDYKLTKAATPNDPRYADGTQWGLHNTGQNSGVDDADIDAPEGWDFGTGTGEHIVAVMDDGVDYNHPDLAANMWRNPGEVAGDGIDNDGNGIADDVFGANFSAATTTGDPLPISGDEHGTHVAGVIGAVGNNAIGISGVAWKTRLMGLNILGTGGANAASVGAEVQALQYGLNMGVTIFNSSFVRQGGFSFAELNAYRGVRNAGAIAVVAAGNTGSSGTNTDVTAFFPSNLSLLNSSVISVAAVDRSDNLAASSNFGRSTVTLAAPGVAIFSTQPGTDYKLLDGTSIAAPHVAGALAVYWDAFPEYSAAQVVTALKRTVRTVPAVNNKVATDGILNLGDLMEQGGRGVYATGTGGGGGPHVKVYDARGKMLTEFFAFNEAFRGGVRVATGDVNGDRYADVIAVAGKGGGPHVKVYDGRTFAEIASFFAFETAFKGGLNVAAGDITGDGRADIIIGADEGGGPRVSVFSLAKGASSFARVSDFFAYDAAFTGGVRVAAGKFTAGATAADVLTGAGFGGGPDVRLFRGTDLTAGVGVPFLGTFAGNPADRSGVFVAAGDFNADGLADIVAGAGAGTATVRVIDGQTLQPIRTLNPPTAIGELPSLTNPAGSGTGTVSSTLLPGVDGGSLTTAAVGSIGITPGLANGLVPSATVPNQLVVTNPVSTPADQNGYVFGVRVAVMDVTRDGKADLILAAGPNDRPIITLTNGSTFNEIRRFNAYDPAFFGGVFVGGPGA